MDAESRQVGNVEYDTIFKNLDENKLGDKYVSVFKIIYNFEILSKEKIAIIVIRLIKKFFFK